MIREGKVAITFFIAYILLVLTIFYDRRLKGVWDFASSCVILGLSLSVTLFVPHSSVAKRAAAIGSVFGVAILLTLGDSTLRFFGWYLASLAFFHISEYVMVAIYSPDKLCLDSFLINHSPEYQVAAVASWVEFVLELWLFPWMKNIVILNFIGIFLMIGGEVLRKLAMMTAESNFTHIIQTKKDKNHVLVTHGIYQLCRHPGYAGWFWWSVGTQVTLVNPFCLGAYIYASWKFFHDRIHDEEITLVYFFGNDYLDYQKEVPTTGVPFVKGFELMPAVTERPADN